MSTRAIQNWEGLASSFWWWQLGIDVLMVLAKDRLGGRLQLASALLDCEEDEEEDGGEEEGEEEEEGMEFFDMPRIEE